MIVGLFPELTTPGGIQRSSVLTALALTLLARGRGESYRFLTLSDAPRGIRSLASAGQEICFTSCGGDKSRLLSHALALAVRQPRVVVALHPNLAPVAVLMKLLAPGMRTVVVAHGVEVWTPLSFVRRIALRSADRVLAPSHDTVSRAVKEQRLLATKVRRLAWSLGPEFDSSKALSPAPPPANFPRGRVILTIGRWDANEAYKGVDHLIKAISELLKGFPNVHLVAVGEGTDLPRLEALAQKSGAADHIHFLPFIAHDQLPAVYDHCEIFAMPSRGEGFGLVFIEAMARGKPVIGGAHGGIPDIIDDGTNGFLTSFGDVPQLLDRLNRLLASETLRREMGLAALAKVRRQFTFARFSGELSSILNEMWE